MTLSVGDEIKWTSQASGFSSEKRGTIIEIVPRGKWLKDVISIERAKAEFAINTDFGGMPRDHESYLVAVPGKTNRAKKRLYWPRVPQLSPIHGR